MKITNKGVEYTLLLVYVFVFLLLALSNSWSSQISHDKPYAYLASDSFLHQSVAQYSKERGFVKYAPPYEIGGYENVLETHPLIVPQLSAIFSIVSGIEVHDAIYLIPVLGVLLTILLVYLIIRAYSVNIAMLSLPVTLLIMSRLFNMGLWWGIWHFLLGVLFMIALIFITTTKLHKKWILFAILFAATIITHPPEAVFLFGFIILYYGIQLYQKKLQYSEIKSVIIGAIAGIILSINYIIIFMQTFLLSEGFRGTASDGYFGFPDIFIGRLGYYGFIFVLGFVFFLLTKKKAIVPALMGIFLFFVSYLTYFGFGKRAFTHRFFWHIYLAFFFGIAMYSIGKLVIKKWNIKHSFVLSLVLIFFLASPLNATTKVGQGIMDPYTWGGLQWVAKNTPENARVYYFVFPPDALSQAAALYDSKRLAFKISYKDVTRALQAGELRNTYIFVLADADPTYIVEKGLFNYCYIRHELIPLDGNVVCEKGYKQPEKPIQETNICDMKYYYFNKFTQQQGFMQFNSVYRERLLANGWVNEVYSNQLVSILVNEKPGVECLE